MPHKHRPRTQIFGPVVRENNYARGVLFINCDGRVDVRFPHEDIELGLLLDNLRYEEAGLHRSVQVNVSVVVRDKKAVG